MMFDELTHAVIGLSPQEQARFRAWFAAFVAAQPYAPTQAERDGIARWLEDVAAGRLATDEEVEAVFSKHQHD